jgi:hypothetical protein
MPLDDFSTNGPPSPEEAEACRSILMRRSKPASSGVPPSSPFTFAHIQKLVPKISRATMQFPILPEPDRAMRCRRKIATNSIQRD